MISKAHKISINTLIPSLLYSPLTKESNLLKVSDHKSLVKKISKTDFSKSNSSDVTTVLNLLEECTLLKDCWEQSMSTKWLMQEESLSSGLLIISPCWMESLMEIWIKSELLENILSKFGKLQAWRCQMSNSYGHLNKLTKDPMSIGCKLWISLVRTPLEESKNVQQSWVKKNQINWKYLNCFIHACKPLMSFSWMLTSANSESIKEKLICWQDNMQATWHKSPLSFHMVWSAVSLKDKRKCQRVIQIQPFSCKTQQKMLRKKLKKHFAKKKLLKETLSWIIAKILFLVWEVNLKFSENLNMEETGNFF